VSDQTVGKILDRHGIPRAPERGKNTTWKEFIGTHKAVLAAADFFTVEVVERSGLETNYVLMMERIAGRRVRISGATVNPDGEWMKQMARNETMEGDGFLEGWCRVVDSAGPSGSMRSRRSGGSGGGAAQGDRAISCGCGGKGKEDDREHV
jgi:hypothetical protein